MKRHETLPLLPIQRGQGVWLYDYEGNRYLDAISSWWVNLFGHSNPQINAALMVQLGDLEHVMLAGFTHEPVVMLSEKLTALSGLDRAFYSSDGSSAIEIALKMSFHFWRNSGQPRKTRFVSLANGYHGETIGALGVTDVDIFKRTYQNIIQPNDTVPSPDWRLAQPGESPADYEARCLEALAQHLAEHHETVAALIIEPLVQGAAGMAMYHARYLTQAKALCQRYDVHLIADEIAVGFGRTGTFFACEQAAVVPDFMCLSKGITGGYLPLSAVLTTHDVYQAFYDDTVSRAFLHSHSYTGNPLACRAALATLAIFESSDVLGQNRGKAACLTQALQPLIAQYSLQNFRQCGMIWAFELEQPCQDFYALALQHQLLLRPIGNTLYLMPPYVIDESEIAFLVTQLQAVLSLAQTSGM